MATLPRRFFYDRAPIIVVPSDVFFLHSGKKINKNNRKRSKPAINDLELFFFRGHAVKEFLIGRQRVVDQMKVSN